MKQILLDLSTKKIFRVLPIILFLCFIFAIQVQAACPTGKVCIDNPARSYFVTAPGTDFASILSFAIRTILLPLAGLVALTFIIIGGFHYIISHGNDEQAEAGKKTLTNAVIGLVIIILAYVIITIVVNFVG